MAVNLFGTAHQASRRLTIGSICRRTGRMTRSTDPTLVCPKTSRCAPSSRSPCGSFATLSLKACHQP